MTQCVHGLDGGNLLMQLQVLLHCLWIGLIALLEVLLVLGDEREVGLFDIGESEGVEDLAVLVWLLNSVELLLHVCREVRGVQGPSELALKHSNLFQKTFSRYDLLSLQILA